MSITTNGSTLRRCQAHEADALGPHTYRKRIQKLEALQAATLAKYQRERAMRISVQDVLAAANQEIHRLTRQSRALWEQVNR